MIKGIEELHQNKERLDQRHHEKMITLEEQEQALREKSNQLAIKERETNGQLYNAWKKENNRRKNKWEKYKNTEFCKKKKMWSIMLGVIIALLMVIILFCIFILDEETLNVILKNKILSIVSLLFSICFSGIVVKNYNDWCHNPNYEEKFKNNLKRLPEMQEISYDDFLKELQKHD